MDQLLKQEMENLKEEVGEISSKVGEISSDVKQMYDALMGNKLVKDGGLIGRVIELEKENEMLEKRVEILEVEKNKSDVYIRILWAMGGAISVGVFSYLLKLIFNN